MVTIETDARITGYGERSARSVRHIFRLMPQARAPEIAELAPRNSSAKNPTELGNLNRRMDQRMRGHSYVKSALDMACWDILGKATGQSVATLMGGPVGEDFAFYRAISQDTPEHMAAKVAAYRSEGYTKFQLKVGSNPDIDIERIRAASR